MTPSLRSHPNHPQQPVSPPYTRNVRGNGCGSGHWLRHSLAGSPLLQTESGSLLFGTAGLPRAAPHPVSRRRSCLRLLSRCSSRDDSDFHWLISYMCVRTSAGVPPATGSRSMAGETPALPIFCSGQQARRQARRQALGPMSALALSWAIERFTASSSGAPVNFRTAARV